MSGYVPTSVKVRGVVDVLGTWRNPGFRLEDGTVCDVISEDYGEYACPGTLYVRCPDGRTALLGEKLYTPIETR